jgi:hypothetical protein|eukprot:COSAG06_NODE_9119_length_1981_cov_5.783173_2_plen_76_part_00
MQARLVRCRDHYCVLDHAHLSLASLDRGVLVACLALLLVGSAARLLALALARIHGFSSPTPACVHPWLMVLLHVG